MTNNNIKAGSTVDRDTFLNQLSAAYGKRAWIECNYDTKNLRNVVVCMKSSPPFQAVDCPFSTTATYGNGFYCKGSLNLPTSTTPAAVSVAFWLLLLIANMIVSDI